MPYLYSAYHSILDDKKDISRYASGIHAAGAKLPLKDDFYRPVLRESPAGDVTFGLRLNQHPVTAVRQLHRIVNVISDECGVDGVLVSV